MDRLPRDYERQIAKKRLPASTGASSSATAKVTASIFINFRFDAKATSFCAGAAAL